MKISCNWLSDFIDWKTSDPQIIADRLTRATGEVEDILLQGAGLEHVVVGKILTLEKHPNADKLSVCTVQTEQGEKKVVCGGTNLKLNILIPFAHVGAELTSAARGGAPVMIGKVTIRGVESEGMICAAEEVGLAEEFPPKPEDGNRAILDLTSLNLNVGTPLREALGLNDMVFHIDNHAITHRPDLFSQIGFARECVALGLAAWKKRPKEIPVKFPAAAPGFILKNDVPDLVPAYRSCVLEMEATAPTPAWMKRRLQATGWRSINLVVDITNYVLMEVGMPLHAFDIDDFKGDLHIRKAVKGEQITTLDGATRALPDGAVVISDDAGIFDLFGVMGGLRTSNKETTNRIFLQAGIIQPTSVRKTMLAMAHRTDASTVYEKGVALATAEQGLKRAIELFLSLHPRARVASKPIQWGTIKPLKPVTVGAETLTRKTGTIITPAQAKKILTDLGYKVAARGKIMSVTPPLWRPDTTIAEDVVEEVARIHGYDKVLPVMPDASTVPPPRDPRRHEIRDALKESGYVEMVHLALMSPELLRKMGIGQHAVAIENPLGEELSILRPCLLPTLLLTTARELRSDNGSCLKTFEVGHAFETGKEWDELCLLVAARGETTLKDDPFLILKADVLGALDAAGQSATIKPTESIHTLGHPGRSAEVLVQGKRIGLLFEVHPKIRDVAGLPFRAAALVADIDSLKSMSPETTLAAPLPMFPSVELDETLPIGTDAHGPMIERSRTLNPLLKNIRVIDLYTKDPDIRTITLRFTYRSDERTLTQQEVEKVHEGIVEKLRNG
ncbi:MAG: phenylalanine--tRNA ligase subunit beta [Candidatus Peribacteraceae bacterium]|nr:phenylalanine--tRNA ligase subunit beta [Candidatus Peribacteraceae bacterium]